MAETNEYVTDALYRIIQNEYDLWSGARFSVQVGYVQGYDNEVRSHYGPPERYWPSTFYSAARVAAMDELKRYIEDQLLDDEGDRTGEYVSRTLAHAAFDLVDWRDLSRHFLQSVAEETNGFYQMNAAEQEAATLAVCRAFYAKQGGEIE